MGRKGVFFVSEVRWTTVDKETDRTGEPKGDRKGRRGKERKRRG